MHSPASIKELDLTLYDFRQGDVIAFNNIYNTYFNSVYYYSKRFIHDNQAAEDITGDIFLKCWEKRAEFENITKLKNFLFISTRNACLNFLRFQKRENLRALNFAYTLESENIDDFDNRNITGTIYQAIYKEIEHLPEQERKVFKLAFIENYSNEKIAIHLNINNQSVRNLKTRALKKLRSAIKAKLHYAFIILLIVLMT